MNVAIFEDIAPCRQPTFRRKVSPPPSGSQIKRARNQRVADGWAWLIFDSEDGDDTYLQNVCSHMDYTELYPRIWQHSLEMNSSISFKEFPDISHHFL
jgi:hypothetical protein